MPARKISPVQSLLSDDSGFCQAERLKSLVTLDLCVFNWKEGRKEGRKEDLSVGGFDFCPLFVFNFFLFFVLFCLFLFGVFEAGLL